MANKISSLGAVILLVLTFTLTSCASYNAWSLLGVNIEDIEKVRSEGKTTTVSLSYDEAFARITQIVKDNGLYILVSSKRKGYIIIIDLPQQTNTTRVGIFFESISDGGTKITLSSLSHSALARAEGIIFRNIE